MTEPKDQDALLRDLPRPAMDPKAEARIRAAARAAYAQAFTPEPWHGRLSATLGRAAVPVALAAVVALYLTWAFQAASSLAH